MLVGAPLKSVSTIAAEEHLEELARLADTAGVVEVGEVKQRLDTRHPKFYIGEGKAAVLTVTMPTSGIFAFMTQTGDNLGVLEGKVVVP